MIVPVALAERLLTLSDYKESERMKSRIFEHKILITIYWNTQVSDWREDLEIDGLTI